MEHKGPGKWKPPHVFLIIFHFHGSKSLIVPLEEALSLRTFFLHAAQQLPDVTKMPWAAAWHRFPKWPGRRSAHEVKPRGSTPLPRSAPSTRGTCWAIMAAAACNSLIWIQGPVVKGRLCFQMWPKIERPERGTMSNSHCV